MRKLKNLFNKHADLISIVLITLLILIFFSHYLTGANLFFATDEASSDLLDFNYPQRIFLADHLKNGKIPLWTPYQDNGFPFLAEAETGVFYPVNLLFFRFFDPNIAFNLSIILSFFIVSLGTYLFLRGLLLSPFSSFFASILIPFSGFFITQLKHVQLMQAASLFPLCLYLTDRLIVTQSKKYMVILALILTCAILAGHIPTAYSLLLFLTFYFFLRLNQEFKKRRESLMPLILYFAAVFFAFSLSAIQLIPTFEMISYSTRSLISPPSPGLPFSHLLTFFNPFLYGDPSRATYSPERASFWENTGYIGILPLLLAFWAFFIKDSRSKILKLMLFLSLFFVTDIARGLMDFLWNFLPGLSFTRISGRFLIFVDFFLLVLAAIALEKIRLKPPKQIIKQSKYIILGILLFCVFDLWGYFYGYNGSIPNNDWQKIPESVKFLKKDHDLFRITTFNQGASYNYFYRKTKGWRSDNSNYLIQKEILPPTLNSLFGVESIHFPNEYFGSFTLARRSRLSMITSDDGISENFAPKLLGMQNTKYLLTLSPLTLEATASFKPVFEKKFDRSATPLTIYRNPEFLPRAYLVSKAIILPDEEELKRFMISDAFRPKEMVILEKNAHLPQSAQYKGKSEVIINHAGEDKLSIAVTATQSGYLVVADTYYPGWKATIDGKPQDILRANYAFRALPISAGKHTIVFSYQPISFLIGTWISLASLGALLIILLFPRMKHNH